MGLTGLSTVNYDYYQYFAGQQQISNILVIITFIMLPIMLCAIPCMHICCGKKHAEHEDNFENVAAQNGDESQ